MDRRALTARELAVAMVVAEGRSNPEVAEVLAVSVATVKRHLNTIMIKWNCANRTQVAVEAIRRGIAEDVRPPPPPVAAGSFAAVPAGAADVTRERPD
ncbi:MAG: LuxR C-terminal-related transcriptional regulator [Dehalococcoidia bacterium]